MPPDSTSSIARRGFTLIEVVIAIGILAVGVATALTVFGSIHRSIGTQSDRERVDGLSDAIEVALQRIRDLPDATGVSDPLDRLANLIPAAGSSRPLRLAASWDGRNVILETEPTGPTSGPPAVARYFLIELRRQAGALAYQGGSGFLAVQAAVEWPYRPMLGPEGGGNEAVTGTASLHFVLTP